MENGDNFYTEGTGITEKPENDIENNRSFSLRYCKKRKHW